MRIVFRASPGLFALSIAALGCASTGWRETTDEIRVLVYNIHAGKDAKGVDNLSRVADIVRSSNADIVLLQEVDRGTTRSGQADQPRILSGLTGFSVAFGKTLDYQGGEYGIAVLSRWPISSDTLIGLPVIPAQLRSGVSHEPRGALRAVIESPAGRLELLNTHIDASREDTYRIQEMAKLLQLAYPIAERGGAPLLGGDLNAEPGSAVIDMLRGSRLRDAWQECGEGNGLSYPASGPVKRIDYLLLSAEWRCVSGKVLETEASDHRPVLFLLRRVR
jgi:endonuclease/exonuclease/phosphatase family metal-dependent hydrolase